MLERRAFLGQVPLVLGPSSWGYGMTLPAPPKIQPITPVPPFYGEWGVVDEDGAIIESGTVGPFDIIDEAFSVAVKTAIDHGATELLTNGFAQVKDSTGKSIGYIT